jgi:hypothetical protein
MQQITLRNKGYKSTDQDYRGGTKYSNAIAPITNKLTNARIMNIHKIIFNILPIENFDLGKSGLYSVGVNLLIIIIIACSLLYSAIITLWPIQDNNKATRGKNSMNFSSVKNNLGIMKGTDQSTATANIRRFKLRHI